MPCTKKQIEACTDLVLDCLIILNTIKDKPMAESELEISLGRSHSDKDLQTAYSKLLDCGYIEIETVGTNDSLIKITEEGRSVRKKVTNLLSEQA